MYSLDRRVCSTENSVVFRGTCAVTGRAVAVKRCRDAATRELDILRSLDHPNLVVFIGLTAAGSSERVFLWHGTTLARHIDDRTLPMPEAREVLTQLARGLEYIHAQGVIHRDVKPDNLLYDGKLLQIADFGNARRTPGGRPHRGMATTLWWRAPEMLRREGYGANADVWSAGVVAAELINGFAPWTPAPGKLENARMLDCIHRFEADRRALFRGRRGSLVAAALALLTVDPDERPDAAAMGALLREED